MPPEPKKPATLLEAILAVQGEVGTLPKTAMNPHFKSKYVPLDTIVEVVGPILNKHGLIWMTFPTMGMSTGVPLLRYSLIHAATGEKIEDEMPLLLTKEDPQGLGSALTYARRYSLCAALNLVADDDDDGNAGSAPKPKAGELARAKANMSDAAKALQADAVALFAAMPPDALSEATFNRYLDSTGYTVEGMQRLVDYLKAAKKDA